MNRSLFVKFIGMFQLIASAIERTINGKKTENTYLFKDMLKKKFSTDLRWDSLTVNNSISTADVVALSSSLPLKKRDKFSTASGEIPKIGMKMKLTEKQMSDIEVLKSRGASEQELAKLIFEDSTKCTMGIYEKLEYLFLQAFSTGTILVNEDTNTGTGIRVEFGYEKANQFGVVTKWSDPNAKPIDDIRRILKTSKTKGDVLKYMFLDSETFDILCANTQVKEQFAFNQMGFAGDKTIIPTLDNEQLKAVFSSRLKLNIVEIDRYVLVEKDGKQNPVKCWADNTVVFTKTDKVGDLVYGTLVEDLNRSKNADYAKLDDFILLKKWSNEEPFEELTSSQAIVLPVINNVSSIYLLNSEDAVTDTQTDGDANIAYNGVNYTKLSVVNAYKAVKPNTTITISTQDNIIIMAINKLSEEEKTTVESAFIPA